MHVIQQAKKSLFKQSNVADKSTRFQATLISNILQHYVSYTTLKFGKVAFKVFLSFLLSNLSDSLDKIKRMLIVLWLPFKVGTPFLKAGLIVPNLR